MLSILLNHEKFLNDNIYIYDKFIINLHLGLHYACTMPAFNELCPWDFSNLLGLFPVGHYHGSYKMNYLIITRGIPAYYSCRGKYIEEYC